MTIDEQTRWHLVEPRELGCRECYDKPAYWCQRCQRLYCLTHLRLVDWQVYQIALADPDAKTVKITAEDDWLRNSGVHHLVCVNCAQDLARFG